MRRFHGKNVASTLLNSLADAELFLEPDHVSVFSDRDARVVEIDKCIHELERLTIEFKSKLPSRHGIVWDIVKLLRGANLRRINSSLLCSNAVLQALKYKRNELAPISQLPVEVLLHIFALCASTSQKPFRLSTTSVGYHSTESIDWIHVTHVSHKWREVAISAPSLWAHITPSPPPWAIEMLSRSNPVPLSVKADFLDLSIKGVKTTPIVLRHLSRIRELTLVIPELGFLQEVLSQPAPILDSLTLRFYHRHRVFALPDSLFAKTAPLLRQMSLDNCHLPWDSSLFRGLTHLRLVNLEMKISLPQFLDTLSGMPFLRELSLRRAVPSLPRDNINAETSPAPLTLSHLSMLYLNGYSSNCANLLNHLKLPTRPFLEFVFEIRNPVVEQTCGIFSAVAQHCGKDDDEKALRHLSIEKISASGLRVQGWFAGSFEPNPSRLINLLLTSRLADWPQKLFRRAAVDVFSLLPLQWLRILYFNLNLKGAWLKARPALDGVDTVFLDEDSVHGWLSALGEGFSDMPGAMGPIVLPALRHIIIRNASFGQATVKETNYRLLSHLLKRRGALGSGIQSLQFKLCDGLTTDDVDKLRESVPDVAWIQAPVQIQEADIRLPQI